jgi:STE24 endopeptidase
VEQARSDAYFEGGYWLLLWVPMYAAAAMWLMLRLSWSARMRDLAGRITKKMPLRTALYAAQFVLLTAAMMLPMTVYTGFIREHQYDLGTQTFGPWLGEQLIGLAISLVIAPVLITMLYDVFRRARRACWLWGSALGVAFVVVSMLLGPVFVAPLFNTYTPVKRPEVRDPVLAMARANGVPRRTSTSSMSPLRAPASGRT